MPFSRGFWAVVFIVFLTAIGGAARAESPAEAAGARKFDAGKKAYEARQFPEALAAFQESLSLLPSPNTRLYIGRCFRALDKPASAYTAFRQAAREASDRVRATDEKRFKATRDTATSEAAEIEGKVPRLTVAMPSDAPEGAAVKLDDNDLPRGAWGTAFEIDPGTYRISAYGPRRKSFETTVVVHEAEQARVDVLIPRLPTGVIVFRFATRPSGLEVKLDGEPVDPTDWGRLREVDTGAHEVSAHASGYDDFVWSKVVGDSEKAEVEIRLSPIKTPAGSGGGGTPRWVFLGVAGLTVVDLGIATGLAIHAKSLSDKQKALDPLERDADTQSQIRSLSADANVMFILGAALAVGSTVLFFTTDWKMKPSERRAIAAPFVTRDGGGGVVAVGRF